MVESAAVLISRFHLSYNECGDDGLSPDVRVSGSLVCHVNLDSLWMVHWEDRRTVETWSHAGLSVWRRVLCGVARMSCLLEFPDTAWLKCFRDIGKKCVLDLNTGEAYTPVQSPESGVETVARMPFFLHCQVAVVPYDTVVPVRGCTRMRGKWTFPGRNTGCDQCDWITSLRVSPQTCTGHTATAFAFSGSNMDDCAGWVLALLSFGVVVYNVERKLPMVDREGASPTTSTPLPGTFLGQALDLGSDQLYDLVDDIPDVMGLRCHSAQCGYCKGDVSAQQPLCQGGVARLSCEHWIP